MRVLLYPFRPFRSASANASYVFPRPVHALADELALIVRGLQMDSSCTNEMMQLYTSRNSTNWNSRVALTSVMATSLPAESSTLLSPYPRVSVFVYAVPMLSNLGVSLVPADHGMCTFVPNSCKVSSERSSEEISDTSG